MILKAIVDEQVFDLNIPEEFITQATDFFKKMDADMDQGWQINREWFDSITPLQRAQIAADKLLTALENEDHNLGRMMAGYILYKNPDIESVELSTHGEVQDHQVHFADNSKSLDFAPSTQGLPEGMDTLLAMEQAQKDVSQVFKVGRQYRFTVYNHGTQKWDESPAISDKDAAEQARMQAFNSRFEAIAAMG